MGTPPVMVDIMPKISGVEFEEAWIRRVDPGISPSYGTMASVFPTFGHEAPNGVWDYGFSVKFVLVPLMLDGRLYLGAVGHNGGGGRWLA